MKVNITIEPPAKKGHFANLFISKEDSHDSINPLRLDFHHLHDFADDTSSTAFDFLMISLFIYCADKILPRKTYSFDGWGREIEICFPVINLAEWNEAKSLLEKTISFLTGDKWFIKFSQLEVELYPNKKTRRSYNIRSYDRREFKAVSLFSGGLDSLVGVIDELEDLKDTGNKMLFASHYDGGAGAKGDQERLVPILEKEYGYESFDYIACGGRLNNMPENSREPSSRSRSILFIGIGTYLANSINNETPLLIPENGTISLNFPLSKSRRSSCSTRTTHPFFLASLQKVLSVVGIGNPLFNPYQFKTKGELVANCKNQSVLNKCVFESVSCGKRGHKETWDNKDARNCGKCMPCIYRRAALHQMCLDTEPYGINIFTSNGFDANGNSGSAQDMSACLNFLKTPHTKDKIGQQLMVNGSFAASDIDAYADIVIRTKKELKDWIKAQNNSRYNQRAGII